MKKGIDFLRAQRQSHLKQEKINRLIDSGSVVLLIFYCLVLAACFWLQITLRRENKTVENQIATTKTKIEVFKSTESLYFILKQRLSYLQKYFTGKKTDYSQILAFFEQAADGVNLETIEILESGDIRTMGAVGNPIWLVSFLDRLTADSGQGFFSEIVLSSLSRSTGGGYTFDFFLKKK